MTVFAPPLLGRCRGDGASSGSVGGLKTNRRYARVPKAPRVATGSETSSGKLPHPGHRQMQGL